MPDKATWVITGQATDQVINTPSNQTVVGVTVYFLTGDGNEGSVFIPNNLYNPTNVHKRVHEKAMTLDAVGALTEGSFPVV